MISYGVVGCNCYRESSRLLCDLDSLDPVFVKLGDEFELACSDTITGNSTTWKPLH